MSRVGHLMLVLDQGGFAPSNLREQGWILLLFACSSGAGVADLHFRMSRTLVLKNTERRWDVPLNLTNDGQCWGHQVLDLPSRPICSTSISFRSAIYEVATSAGSCTAWTK